MAVLYFVDQAETGHRLRVCREVENLFGFGKGNLSFNNTEFHLYLTLGNYTCF